MSVFTTSLNRYTARATPATLQTFSGSALRAGVQARQARHCACIPTVEGRGPPSPIGTVDLRLAPFPTGCLRTGIGVGHACPPVVPPSTQSLAGVRDERREGEERDMPG